jgi:ABC-type multidrug transport system fused ATPase/permease subunit
VLLLEVGLIFHYISGQTQAGEIIMIGVVTAIFQYVGQLMAAFGFYAGDYEKVINWQIDFHAIEPIMVEAAETNHLEAPDLGVWNRLDIHSLSYSYGDGMAQLKDISLSLTRDRKIAIVGESGAGKSTLLQILRGLTPVRDGSITIDDRIETPISALANTTTLIPQQAEIFENTMGYNVTMGLPASKEAVRSAMDTAQFSEVVARLPSGINSDVREKGVNLSGGEMQRLALARGVFAIRNTQIILLDEPTGSVDPATEMQIFERLFDLLSSRCVICVLHRLHLVSLFDYVYVMKHGKIVEEGTFNHLRDVDGEFSRLWDRYQAEENSGYSTR